MTIRIALAQILPVWGDAAANLAQIARNRTVIIVSHRLSMLKDADMIIVLQRGELVGQGAHGHLLEHCELYRTLWQQQMELT